jgi:hypothetical protein
MKKLLCAILVGSVTVAPLSAAELENIFQTPPSAARPHVMWMWMGCNITKASITKDLEAFRDAGFGGTLMFSCADTTTPWPGNIGKSPTPEKLMMMTK